MSRSVDPAEPSALGITPKLACALSDPYGGRILSALGTHDLSPSQFVEQFGGDLDYVSRCFRRLRRLGFADLVERRPGRRRGAAVEHVYRAAGQADPDLTLLRALPPRLRGTPTYRTLDGHFEAAAEAIREGTFDSDAQCHLSWDSLALDRQAFAVLGERLEEVQRWVASLEAGAPQRAEARGKPGHLVSVGLTSFRSPLDPTLVVRAPSRQPHPAAGREGDEGPVISLELAKALSNRWRSRILMELNLRPMSPSQFVEEVGGDRSYIARCFRELAAWGYAEIEEERKGGRRGGGVERVYRKTARACFDEAAWRTLPAFLRSEILVCFLSSYVQIVADSLLAGTFDSEANRHLSFRQTNLSPEAWRMIGPRLDRVMEWVLVLEAESLERAGGDASRLIPTVVGTAGFRSPHRTR